MSNYKTPIAEILAEIVDINERIANTPVLKDESNIIEHAKLGIQRSIDNAKRRYLMLDALNGIIESYKSLSSSSKTVKDKFEHECAVFETALIKLFTGKIDNVILSNPSNELTPDMVSKFNDLDKKTDHLLGLYNQILKNQDTIIHEIRNLMVNEKTNTSENSSLTTPSLRLVPDTMHHVSKNLQLQTAYSRIRKVLKEKGPLSIVEIIKLVDMNEIISVFHSKDEFRQSIMDQISKNKFFKFEGEALAAL